MRKYPIELQDEEKACGAYCILMILKYYGFQEEVKEIKKKARLNQNGITMKGMIECLKSYQIEAKGYEATLNDIVENVKCPCILYMIYEGVGHYVVLYEIKDDEYIIGDPAQGLLIQYSEEMQEHYALRMIAIQHVGRVPELSYKPYSQFLKETFLSYRKQMIMLITKGLWISVLGYMSGYFFQFIIDRIHLNTKFFYIVVLCSTYCFVELMKVRFEKLKGQQTIYLQQSFDEDYVFSSSMKMLHLPFSFFYQDQGYIQSQLLSLFDLSEMSLGCFERMFLDGLSFIVFILGMFFINMKMTFIVCVMLWCVGMLAYHRLKSLQEINKNYLEASYVYQHHLLELIENQFLIKRFLRLQSERERSFHIYYNQAEYKVKQALFFNQLQSHIQYIIYFFYGFIMLIGFYDYQHNYMSMGQLMMFYMLISYCIQPVINIVTLMSQYKQMSLIYEKYKAFDNEETVMKEEIDTIHSITFDNVSYAYGYEAPLLEHIDLKIDHHLILKGNTGSGKSTLLRLLMGYDFHYTGDIFINDLELRKIDLNSLYQHIGYTNETPTFLHLSLLENFLCDDEEKIRYYLKVFGQLHLADMFHVILSEDGAPLSLGQRQVVGLIRLLCQGYDVLILDEAFSHMDSRLASKILRYLMKNDEGKIYIMVNHQTKIVNKEVGCAIIEKGRLRIER